MKIIIVLDLRFSQPSIWELIFCRIQRLAAWRKSADVLVEFHQTTRRYIREDIKFQLEISQEMKTHNFLTIIFSDEIIFGQYSSSNFTLGWKLGKWTFSPPSVKINILFVPVDRHMSWYLFEMTFRRSALLYPQV
jgi:hypothetical protein